jgi:hypothetical protein
MSVPIYLLYRKQVFSIPTPRRSELVCECDQRVDSGFGQRNRPSPELEGIAGRILLSNLLTERFRSAFRKHFDDEACDIGPFRKFPQSLRPDPTNTLEIGKLPGQIDCGAGFRFFSGLAGE